ncbi:MAG: hypothetical protein Q7T46_11455 [Polaromonas sp.]|nr:hypothetical protein [Polaromonas sp.]
MNQIAKNVDAAYSEDLVAFDEETGQTSPLERKRETVEADDAQDDAPAEAAAEQPKPAPEDDLIAIVVDGQEVKVKRDQLIDAGRRTLQKESAADRRLQDATETLNRARAYERSLLQQGQPSPDVGNEEQVPSSDASNGNGNSAHATPDLRTLVKQELWKENAVKAADRFVVEFKEIADDPLAYQLVVQLENDRLAQAAAEGLPLGDPWNAYKAHGEKVMTWLGKSRGTTPAIPDDKTERKRGTVTVVGSGTRQPTPQPQKVLTMAEQIEKMRTSRQGRPVQTNR